MGGFPIREFRLSQGETLSQGPALYCSAWLRALSAVRPPMLYRFNFRYRVARLMPSILPASTLSPFTCSNTRSMVARSMSSKSVEFDDDASDIAYSACEGSA